MAAWFLNPALTRFRNEVNDRWPRRDHASDGTIGDLAHQLSDSDHNPDRDGSVDAWDMDNDGVPVDAVIAAALKHEAIQYVIWNRRITSRSWGLGTWRPYTGASAHTEHVHFNTREAYENSTKPWFAGGTVTAQDDALKAILTGNGSGTFGEPNNLHVKINKLSADIAAVRKVAEAAAGRADGLLGMTDVTTTWSDVTPAGKQVNKLAAKINSAAAPVTLTDAQLAQIVAGVVAALKAGAFVYTPR